MQSPSTSAAAALTDRAAVSSSHAIAAVSEISPTLNINCPFIKIIKLDESNCNIAIIDTGSPVCFIKYTAIKNKFKFIEDKMKSTCENYKSLSGTPVYMLAKLECSIRLEQLPSHDFKITLNIIYEDSFQGDVIIGHDFLEKQKLTLVYDPSRSSREEAIELFPAELLNLNVLSVQTIEDVIDDSHIDFGKVEKDRLKSLVTEIEARADSFVLFYLCLRTASVRLQGTKTNQRNNKRAVRTGNYKTEHIVLCTSCTR